MKSMVVGVLALARALAREPGEAVQDRPAWDKKGSSSVLPRVLQKGDGDGDASGDLASVLAPGSGGSESASGVTGEMSSDGADNAADESSDATAPAGHWEIACEIKSGSALVFDRASLRDYGPVTLFRWSAPRVRVAGPGEQIFTAVVNCREKTIEAAWPGRSRETYTGTCGRGLVEAVCAAAEQASAGGRPHAPGGASRAVHQVPSPHR